jgi:hypothetical protein
MLPENLSKVNHIRRHILTRRPSWSAASPVRDVSGSRASTTAETMKKAAN